MARLPRFLRVGGSRKGSGRDAISAFVCVVCVCLRWTFPAPQGRIAWRVLVLVVLRAAGKKGLAQIQADEADTGGAAWGRNQTACGLGS